jgi:hypothetical protein
MRYLVTCLIVCLAVQAGIAQEPNSNAHQKFGHAVELGITREAYKLLFKAGTTYPEAVATFGKPGQPISGLANDDQGYIWESDDVAVGIVFRQEFAAMFTIGNDFSVRNWFQGLSPSGQTLRKVQSEVNHAVNDLRESEAEDLEAQAISAAEDRIRTHLKSPASAVFSNIRVNTQVKSYQWTIRGTVDSQNGFGAMLRSNWSVHVTYKKGTRDDSFYWHTQYVTFDRD